jgi:hypothetical protein
VLPERSGGADIERQPDSSISSVKGFGAYRGLAASLGRLRLGPFEGPAIESPRLCRGIVTCAWHDAQAVVPGEAWDIMVRRYRTEGRRQQGKGISGNGMSEGSMRQNPCT